MAKGKKIQNEKVYCIKCHFIGDMDVEIPASDHLEEQECPDCGEKELRLGTPKFMKGTDGKIRRI